MAPTSRPFVVDPALTAIAIAYNNPAQSMIADRVLPRQPVGQETFKWTEYPLVEGFTVPNTRVGRRGQVNQVVFNGEERESAVEDFGLDAPVVVSDINAAAAARAAKRSTYDPEGHAAEAMTRLVELDREIRVAGVVQNPANYAADRKVALAGNEQLSDFVNSDPYGVLDEAIDGLLVYRANALVMGQPVWAKIKRHPRLIKAVKGGLSDEGAITKQQLADLLEIREVIVGESFVNTARPGQAAALNRVWGNFIAALYIDPAARPEGEMTWGITATFGTRISGRIEDPNIGLEGGFRIRSGERVKELIVAKDLGYLIQNPIAA